MSTDPIKPIYTAEHEETRGKAVSLGERIVQTARGDVKISDAPGFTTFLIERADRDSWRIGLLVYAPAPDAVGSGMICQVDAGNARTIAASLLRLADHLEPVSTN